LPFLFLPAVSEASTWNPPVFSLICYWIWFSYYTHFLHTYIIYFRQHWIFDRNRINCQKNNTKKPFMTNLHSRFWRKTINIHGND
jgi:hypothetical protein